MSIESAPFDETRKKIRKLPDANQPLASHTAWGPGQRLCAGTLDEVVEDFLLRCAHHGSAPHPTAKASTASDGSATNLDKFVSA